MAQEDTNLPVSEWRLDEIRRYVSTHIPLVPKGQSIVIDESALDGLLVKGLAQTTTLWEDMKGFYLRLRDGKRPENPLAPEQTQKLRGMLLEEFNRVSAKLPFPAEELENETTAPRRVLIMAGPEELTYDKTPERKIDIFRKWFCVRHALVKAGAHVEILPVSNRGGIREVYTRDRYVMIGDTAYLPDPRKLQDMAERGLVETSPEDVASYTGEVEQIRAALHLRGVKTVIVEGAWFEGGNVVRHTSSKTIFVGVDEPWSSKDSAEKLIRAVNTTQPAPWSLLSVPLADPEKLYHLDTGMSEELPHGEVMLSPRVTDAETYKKIRAIVGSENIITLSEYETNRLATNLIDVGDTLVMTGSCKSLKQKLTARGYTVVMPKDYGQLSFEFGKGGVHCMTNDVRQPVRSPKPALH